MPVLAAGGIADGRGIAAALVPGAAGALLGTRFQATLEAIVDPMITKAVLDGAETIRRSTRSSTLRAVRVGPPNIPPALSITRSLDVGVAARPN
jgi:nitronate monooxygenase